MTSNNIKKILKKIKRPIKKIKKKIKSEINYRTLLKQKNYFANPNLLTSRGYASFAKSHPFPKFIFEPTGKQYTPAMIRQMFKKNQSSYWINQTPLEDSFINNVSNLYEEILKDNQKEYILLLSDGAVSVPTLKTVKLIEKLLRSEKLIHIYTQNLNIELVPKNLRNKISSIPIGLDLHTDRKGLTPKKIHNYFTKNHRLNAEPRNNKILVDFKDSITDSKRKTVLDAIKNHKSYEILDHRIPQIELWEKYKKYKYVLSIRGFGIDCHRTWEAIYLGIFPITLSEPIDPLIIDHGGIIFNQISELTDQNILEVIDERTINQTLLTPNILSVIAKKHHHLLNI